ncbi:MAG TPA: hypothetical protein VKZ18_00100, partial [Polyangia bacterium]|nr:hypothetical protein [Polyangia bacterium]
MKPATKLLAPFALVLSFAWLQQSNVARADEHHGGEHQGQEHQGHQMAPPHEHAVVPRPAPPRFQPH